MNLNSQDTPEMDGQSTTPQPKSRVALGDRSLNLVIVVVMSMAIGGWAILQNPFIAQIIDTAKEDKDYANRLNSQRGQYIVTGFEEHPVYNEFNKVSAFDISFNIASKTPQDIKVDINLDADYYSSLRFPEEEGSFLGITAVHSIHASQDPTPISFKVKIKLADAPSDLQATTKEYTSNLFKEGSFPIKIQIYSGNSALGPGGVNPLVLFSGNENDTKMVLSGMGVAYFDGNLRTRNYKISDFK